MAKLAMTGQIKNGAARRTANLRNQVCDETVEIQRLAYQFFVEGGSQHGHDQEDWIRAEAIVKNRTKI